MLLFDVRVKGLEPPRITPPDPKSGAAANYAIPALDCKGIIFPANCIEVIKLL